MAKKENYLKRLEKLMEHFNWNQSDVARDFKVGRGSVSHWFLNQREMSGPVKRLIEMHEYVIELEEQLGIEE